MGAPLNAPSTSASVASPLPAPLVAWVILKIAPPNVPDCVLTFFFLPLAAASRACTAGRAVVRFSVPCRALITVLAGIC